MENEAKLVRYLLEKGGIILPLCIFKEKMLIELEKAILSKNSYLVSRFYRKVYENIDEYLNLTSLLNITKTCIDFYKRVFIHGCGLNCYKNMRLGV